MIPASWDMILWQPTNRNVLQIWENEEYNTSIQTDRK